MAKKKKTSKKVMRQRITKARKELKADGIKIKSVRRTKAKRAKIVSNRGRQIVAQQIKDLNTESANEPRIVTKLRKIAISISDAETYDNKLHNRRDKIAMSVIRLADSVFNAINADAKKKVKDADTAERNETRAKRRAEIDAKRHIRDEAKQERHDAKIAKKRDKLTALRLAAEKLAKEIGE